MFSGLIRWFNQNVAPSISSEVSTFLAPLALDVETAGGSALTQAVQVAVNQANAGKFDIGQIFQAGVDAGKGYLTSQGVTDLNHAVIGVAAAAISNLHAASVGAVVNVAHTNMNVSLAPVVPQETAVVHSEVPENGLNIAASTPQVDVIEVAGNPVAVPAPVEQVTPSPAVVAETPVDQLVTEVEQVADTAAVTAATAAGGPLAGAVVQELAPIATGLIESALKNFSL